MFSIAHINARLRKQKIKKKSGYSRMSSNSDKKTNEKNIYALGVHCPNVSQILERLFVLPGLSKRSPSQ